MITREPILRASLAEADALLLVLADSLDDLEHARIAAENRHRSLTMEPPHGKGMADSKVAATLQGIVDGLGRIEHEAELELKRSMREHPFGSWVRRTKGVGEKQAARMLAAIGDPLWKHTLEESRPRRGLAELWAYCGFHVVLSASQVSSEAHPAAAGADADGSAVGGQGSSDTQWWRAADRGADSGQRSRETHITVAGVAPRPMRGQKANWSRVAKMRTWLVATSCIKQRCKQCAKAELSPGEVPADCSCAADGFRFRVVYDGGRRKYAEAMHVVDCIRCGPSGQPALAGSALSDGHKHARAIRLVCKAILRDLWDEGQANGSARPMAGSPPSSHASAGVDGQGRTGTQTGSAVDSGHSVDGQPPSETHQLPVVDERGGSGDQGFFEAQGDHVAGVAS